VRAYANPIARRWPPCTIGRPRSPTRARHRRHAEGGEFWSDWDQSFDSFDQMDLHENLLRGIYAYGGSLHPVFRTQVAPHQHAAACIMQAFATPAGFEKPSAIQQKGIVPFGKGLDVIQQAQSGTGKTATFCAGILQRLDYGELDCQALVLAPTRELAQQIEKVMRALGDYLEVSTGSETCSGSHAS